MNPLDYEPGIHHPFPMNPLDYEPGIHHPFPNIIPDEIPDTPEEDEDD